MTLEEFDKLIKEELLPKCFEIMSSKGISYSGLEDKLGNFKRGASLTGSEPKKVLFIYLMKHIDSISSFVRNEYKDSEKIESRVMDVINYMFLLYALLVEEKVISKNG